MRPLAISPETAVKLAEALQVPLERLMHMPQHILLQKMMELAKEEVRKKRPGVRSFPLIFHEQRGFIKEASLRTTFSCRSNAAFSFACNRPSIEMLLYRQTYSPLRYLQQSSRCASRQRIFIGPGESYLHKNKNLEGIIWQ